MKSAYVLIVAIVGLLLSGLSAGAQIAQPASKPIDAATRFRHSIREAAQYAYDEIAYRLRTEPAEFVAIQKWMDRFGESVKGVSRSTLSVFTPGCSHTLSADGKRVYLHVLDHHLSGRAAIHGLSDEGLEKVYWLGSPDREMKREFTGKAIVIEVTAKNEPAPDALDTVVVLQYAKRPKTVLPAAVAQPDGSFVLHARDAIVEGSNLRYEPEPNKNTLGYWTNPADFATFLFYPEKGGMTYDVEVLQGCGKGSGGSEVEFRIGPTVLPMVVEDTGHFQNFVPRKIGRVQVGMGLTNVTVRVKSKKGAAVMDLRQVKLTPVKE